MRDQQPAYPRVKYSNFHVSKTYAPPCVGSIPSSGTGPCIVLFSNTISDLQSIVADHCTNKTDRRTNQSDIVLPHGKANCFVLLKHFDDVETLCIYRYTCENLI